MRLLEGLHVQISQHSAETAAQNHVKADGSPRDCHIVLPTCTAGCGRDGTLQVL